MRFWLSLAVAISSAISTTLWAYLKPNDTLLMSEPLYGGTETLIDKTMPAFGCDELKSFPLAEIAWTLCSSMSLLVIFNDCPTRAPIMRGV